MPYRKIMIAPLAALALAACAGYGSSETSAAASKAPAVKVVGDAQSCIPIVQIRSSTIHDDYTIDFEVGSRTYRSTLPHRCSGLGSEDAFTYETSLTQLCDTDIIYVLRNVGGTLERGAGCGLGSFVPVERIK